MSGHRSIFIEVLQVVKIIFLLPFLTLPTDGQIFYSMKLIGVLCGGTVADQSVDAAHPAQEGMGGWSLRPWLTVVSQDGMWRSEGTFFSAYYCTQGRLSRRPHHGQ